MKKIFIVVTFFAICVNINAQIVDCQPFPKQPKLMLPDSINNGKEDLIMLINNISHALKIYQYGEGKNQTYRMPYIDVDNIPTNIEDLNKYFKDSIFTISIYHIMNKDWYESKIRLESHKYKKSRNPQSNNLY